MAEYKKKHVSYVQKKFILYGIKKIEINFCKLQRQGKAFFETSSAALIIPFIEKCINPYVYVTNFTMPTRVIELTVFWLQYAIRTDAKQCYRYFFQSQIICSYPSTCCYFQILKVSKGIYMPFFMLASACLTRAGYGFHGCSVVYPKRELEFKIQPLLVYCRFMRHKFYVHHQPWKTHMFTF